MDKQQGYIIIIILFYKSCVAAQESCTVREKEIDRQRKRDEHKEREREQNGAWNSKRKEMDVEREGYKAALNIL